MFTWCNPLVCGQRGAELRYHCFSPTTVNKATWVTSFFGLSLCRLNLWMCACVVCVCVCAARSCMCICGGERGQQRNPGNPRLWSHFFLERISVSVCLVCALYVLVGLCLGLEERPRREKHTLKLCLAQHISHYTACALWVQLTRSSYGSNQHIILDINAAPSI